MGVRLKSDGPSISSYADLEGSRREVRNKFRVSCICARNKSQSCNMQLMSTVARPVMMWYLVALTAGSAALTLWL